MKKIQRNLHFSFIFCHIRPPSEAPSEAKYEVSLFQGLRKFQALSFNFFFNMKKYEGNMKKYEGNTEKYERNMKEI